MDPSKQSNSSSNQASGTEVGTPADAQVPPMPGQADAPQSSAPAADAPAAPDGESSFTPSPATPPSPTAPVTPTAPADGQSASAPASEAPAQAAVSPQGMVSPKKSKKPLLLGGIVAAVALVLLGAGAAAYMAINKPQNVLNMALLNSFSADKAKTASFEGKLDITPSGGEALPITFSGAGSQSGAYTVKATMELGASSVGLDMLSTDGSTMYLRASGLAGMAQALGADAAYGTLVKGLDGQWVKLDPSMLKQLTGSDTSLETKLSDADRQKLMDAYKDNQFLVVSKSLPDETIQGEVSHHYEVTIDKIHLKNFVVAVKKADIKAIQIDSAMLKSYNDAIDKADFSKNPLEVWIAKDSKLVDQVSFKATQDGTKVALRVTIDNYNKPVNIAAPSGAKSFIDVLSNLMGGTSGVGLDSGISL